MSKSGVILSGKRNVKANKMLFEITNFLDKESIKYHLEGGTLLGIVRDNGLLPWDHDIDISIPFSEVNKIIHLKRKFLFMGYKLSMKKSTFHYGPINKGDYYVFKLKPIFEYIAHFLFPIFHKKMIVLDIFVKINDDFYTYWQAAGKVMKVEKKYYESEEAISYNGKIYSAPNFYKDYLTQKYGDWSIVIKQWNCGMDEKTICEKEVS